VRVVDRNDRVDLSAVRRERTGGAMEGTRRNFLARAGGTPADRRYDEQAEFA